MFVFLKKESVTFIRFPKYLGTSLMRMIVKKKIPLLFFRAVLLNVILKCSLWGMELKQIQSTVYVSTRRG